MSADPAPGERRAPALGAPPRPAAAPPRLPPRGQSTRDAHLARPAAPPARALAGLLPQDPALPARRSPAARPRLSEGPPQAGALPASRPSGPRRTVRLRTAPGGLRRPAPHRAASSAPPRPRLLLSTVLTATAQHASPTPPEAPPQAAPAPRRPRPTKAQVHPRGPAPHPRAPPQAVPALRKPRFTQEAPPPTRRPRPKPPLPYESPGSHERPRPEALPPRPRPRGSPPLPLPQERAPSIPESAPAVR